MKTKLLSSLLIILLPLGIAGCNKTGTASSSEEQSSVEPNPFIVSEAPYYFPTYKDSDFKATQDGTLAYGYYEKQDQLIYMSFDVALERLYDDVSKENITNGIKYTVTGGMSFSVDYDKDTILVKNYSLINLFSMEYDTPLGVIDEQTTTKYVKDGGTTYTDEEDVLFNLKNYSLDIVHENDNVYVPYSVVNFMIFNPALYSSVIFNGNGFYFLDMMSGAAGMSAPSTLYHTKFYSQSPYKKTEKPDYMVDYNYQSFMFSLDNFYGFNDERFVPFSDYLEQNYKQVNDDLKSKDEATYSRAVERLINEIIGDGHTNAGGASSLYGGGSYSMGRYNSQRSIQLSRDAYDLYYKRADASTKVDTVRFKGNTAILSFDSFSHAEVDFTSSNIDSYSSYDSFALFHKAFKDIKKRSNIENVIFDVTVNGGGDTNALVPMLGFLTDKVQINMYNPLNKQTGYLAYQIDTNLDGVYDEKDNYKDDYNYFVLTSNYSFSCANLFTATCKEYGLATIIGEQSGGGACVVYYTSTPDGRCYRISGNMRDCDKTDSTKHFDFGVPVDYELERINFYNDTYLDQFVNNLGQ